METKVIRYDFQLPDNSREAFKFELNAKNLELKGSVPKSLPPWTQLEYHQCANCQLDDAAHPYCPLAANIHNIVQRFDGLNSYDQITVEVVTDQRWIAQRTTAQLGISSMMGLVIAACGCPHTAFFKPMAWFHLPLASEEETLFRASSFYMAPHPFTCWPNTIVKKMVMPPILSLKAWPKSTRTCKPLTAPLPGVCEKPPPTIHR